MTKFTLEELYKFQTEVTSDDFKSRFHNYELWDKFLDTGRNVVTLYMWIPRGPNQLILIALIRQFLGK